MALDRSETSRPPDLIQHQVSSPSLSSPRLYLRWGGAVVVWATAVAIGRVYLATAAPCAWWGDGMELTCAAWTLGIPHPTGYPLYTLTGHLMIRLLGWLDPGRALTLYSLLLMATASGVLISLLRRVISDAQPGDRIVGCDCAMSNLLPAISGGLLIAFSRTAWEHATFAEVYPLTFLLALLIISLTWTAPANRVGMARAATLGGLMGLAALNHYSIVALAPLAIFSVLRWSREAVRPWRMIVTSGGGVLVMLAGYLYLPLRALANPPLNWGDPSSLKGLVWVLSGGQFRDLKVLSESIHVTQGLALWVRWWGEQWTPLPMDNGWMSFVVGLFILAVATVGLGRLARRRWDLGWGLMGILGATAAFGAFYHIPDIDAYFLVGLPAVAVGWTVASSWALERVQIRRPLNTLGRVLPALAALAVVGMHGPVVDKSGDETPLIWGAGVMQSLPEGAIVLTGEDADIYALWYQQMVLGKRPDVTIFGSNFIFQSWYLRYFESAGREAIPTLIENRPPKSKWAWDVALFQGTILPNFARGHRIFATFRDDQITQYLSPKAVAQLLPRSYYDASSHLSLLPAAFLYELQPNPALGAMEPEELERELTRAYAPQPPPGP